MTDISTRELLQKLEDEERKHSATAGDLEEKHLTATRARRKTNRIANCFCCRWCSRGWRG